MTTTPLPASLPAGLAPWARGVVAAVLYALALRHAPALPPGFLIEQPLSLAGAVALAAGALWGAAGVLGALVGALALAVPALDPAAALSLILAAIHGAVGWALMHGPMRRGELRLDNAPEWWRHLGGPALLAASAATVARAAARSLEAGTIAPTWLAALWGADLAGLLIVVPVLFAFAAVPAGSWRRRRLGLALPMLVCLGGVMIVTLAVARWSEQRARAEFEIAAKAMRDRIDSNLHKVLDIVNAGHGATFAAGRPLDASRFESTLLPWLHDAPMVGSVSWIEPVARADADAYVARVRAEGLADFRLHAWPGGVPEATLARDPQLFVLRHLVSLQAPAEERRAALGLNALSLAEARSVLLGALAGGPARATPPFELMQAGRPSGRRVAVYRPVRLAETGAVGFVVASLQLDLAFEPAFTLGPRQLAACIVDMDFQGDARQRHLAGAPDCASQPGAATDRLVSEELFEFAGRAWLSRLAMPMDAALVGAGVYWNTWLFVWPGLLGSALLCALLLFHSARVQRIESEVAQRTAQLTRESHERREAQQAAARALQELRSVYDTVTAGLVQVTPDGTIADANPAFCEILGYRPDEVRGHGIAEFSVMPDDPVRRQVDEMVRDGKVQSVRGEKAYRHKDGHEVPVSVHVRTVRDAQGRALYTVGVVQDLTEAAKRREAERERDRAEAANRAKSQFVARMSHELRTPLNAILGFAQLIDAQSGERLPPAQRDWLRRLSQAGWHLLDMINDVLDLSRLESDALELSIGQVDLHESITSSAAMVESSAAGGGVAVVCELEPDARFALGDAVRVRQVLLNLMSNAVKYNRPGGRVVVHCRRGRAGTLEVEVSDTGLGLDDAQLALLFEPFNRLGRERTGVQGTGIGLTIARHLAQRMGGRLDVHSAPGEGSSFTLVLPAGAAGDAAPSTRHPALGGAGQAYAPCRVLAIEDNDTNVQILRAMLALRPQIEVLEAPTGAQGLAQARTQGPDLVLLDLDLPDIDGLEVLRRLRADPATAALPVIVVSAHAQAELMNAALEAGANDYVAKPLEVAALLHAVDRQLAAQDALP
jgi:PAS domain S-box-containing protein